MLIRGIPRSHESSKSSRVKRLRKESTDKIKQTFSLHNYHTQKIPRRLRLTIKIRLLTVVEY